MCGIKPAGYIHRHYLTSVAVAARVHPSDGSKKFELRSRVRREWLTIDYGIIGNFRTLDTQDIGTKGYYRPLGGCGYREGQGPTATPVDGKSSRLPALASESMYQTTIPMIYDTQTATFQRTFH